MSSAGRPVPKLVLSDAERRALDHLVESTDKPALRLRAEMIIRCAAGAPNYQVAAALDVTASTVGKWRRRFVQLGLAGLDDGPRNGRPRLVDRTQLDATLLADQGDRQTTRQRLTTRRLAKALEVSQSTASRLAREGTAFRRVTEAAGGAVPNRTPVDTPPLLSDWVYEVVRGWIASGELQPGGRVSESELASVLGTSPTPAREAIRRLAQEGLITHRPRLGNFVAEISQVEAREAREVRVLIETAAARRATGRLTAQEITRLRTHIAAMRTAAERDNIAAFRQADLSFHRDVCALSGNSMLARMWSALEPALWNLQVVSSAMYVGDWREMARRHDDLVDALLDADPAESVRLFSAHARGESSAIRPRRTHEHGPVAEARPPAR